MAHCDAVMYGDAAVRAATRIDIVIDLSDTDVGSLSALTQACAREDLRDGLRLWACLPFAVDCVDIVLPRGAPLLGRMVGRLARMLLSEKLQRKVRFVVT